MKIFSATAAIAFLAAISAASVFAQQPRTSAPTQGAASMGSLPDTKVALVNSDAFSDEKNGIVRLVNAARRLDNDFAAKRKELEDLDAQIKKATADLTKAATLQDPKVTQQQQDKIDQMKRDLQRKTEDAQTAYQKRLQQDLGPIYEDIGKALEAYAKAHGITLILDVTKVQGIVAASESLDITGSFITEFNSKNPATASLTPPK